MPEPAPPDRSRSATWLLRVKIIALGLSLGIGARWLQSAWEAYGRPGTDPVTNTSPAEAETEQASEAKK